MLPKAFLYKVLVDIRASYWFLPAVLVCVAIVASQGTIWLDQHPHGWAGVLPDAILMAQPEGARSTLAVIAQSVIGVTGVMFSMTMVAVSFASGQFGPRLIGNLMRDQGNQISLGILIATFVYALLVLQSVQNPQHDGTAGFVPHISLMVAVLLTLVSVFTMIFFIHHVPETINVSNITAGLGARLDREIRGLIDAQARAPDIIELPDLPHQTSIALGASGYVQTLDVGRLEELAKAHELVIEIRNGPGAFVAHATQVMCVHGQDPLSEQTCKALRHCFALGSRRTEAQNVIFIIDQLVEMIARALSPGVNDPYTAINCLNWVFAGLATGLEYKGGLQPPRPGRIRREVIDAHRLFEAAIATSAPYVASDRLVRDTFNALVGDLQTRARSEAEADRIAAMRISDPEA